MEYPHDDNVESLIDEERNARVKPRHCTDIPCLVLFFAFCAGLIYCADVARKTGDIRRLSHGFNYRGQLCGVSEGVENRPFLYFCPNGPDVPGQVPHVPTSLDLEHPICVRNCPTNATQKFNCYMGSTVTQSLTREPNEDYSVTINYDFQSTVGYPTYPYMHRYCVPAAKDLAIKVIDQVCSGWVSLIMTKVGSLRSGYPALVYSIGLAFILGYAYLLTLRLFARILVYACLITLIIGSLVAGGFLIYVGMNESVNSACGNATLDIVVGAFSLLISGILSLLTACKKNSIDMAIACVEAACECMFAMPTLLLQPLIEIIAKVFVLSLLLYGFLWVVSTGDVSADTAIVGGKKVGGLSRSFTWTDEQKMMIFYWAFGICWIMGIFNALGQFCVSYSVMLWYFTPKEDDGSKESPNCPLGRAATNGICYHFGTLAFGAFLVTLCDILRFFLGYLAKQAENTGNAVMSAISKACMCCVSCFKRFMEFINKNAYMDVAINSTNFCTAAQNAFSTITGELAAVALLNGACFIFQIAGGLLITGCGSLLTYMIITTQDMFTSNMSNWFVADPVFLSVASGFVCLAVAWVFMIIFDQTADTLLYCFITDKNNPMLFHGRRVQFAPTTLQVLVSEAK